MINPQLSSTETIKKGLATAKLFAGFWDRWIAHGMNREEVSCFRSQLLDLTSWIKGLNELAVSYEDKASSCLEKNMIHEAEIYYRLAGLHFNLIQWIFPTVEDEKKHWYQLSKLAFDKADSISAISTIKTTIRVNNGLCYGRIRIPENPKGCIVMINPFDSAKEELFSYEMDFANLGFVVLNFDGPGQGETYASQNFKASNQNWEEYLYQVIAFAASSYSQLPIHLFGTSSGAAWAIHGSSHPMIFKVAAVSPAVENDVRLPDYFVERMNFMQENTSANFIPKIEDCSSYGPIFLFHGNQDVMVRDRDIHELYQRLPQGKKLIEYADEGHCCNFKLEEIRKLAADWFLEVR